MSKNLAPGKRRILVVCEVEEAAVVLAVYVPVMIPGYVWAKLTLVSFASLTAMEIALAAIIVANIKHIPIRAIIAIAFGVLNFCFITPV